MTITRKALIGAAALCFAAGALGVVHFLKRSAEPLSKGTPVALRLLTQQQYLNTLEYVFGPDVKPVTNFAAVPRVDGLLSSGTAVAGLTDTQAEIYQKTATAVAAQVTGEDGRQFRVPCAPAKSDAADADCARNFLSAVGPLLYRRPVPPERLKVLVDGASTAADTLHDFYKGLGVAIEGLLMSPNVLLVVETSESDPNNPGKLRLDGYSLATRLSLFLWDAAPDAELLHAAASGALQTRTGLEQQVDRMLASPRLETGVRAMFDDMFGFEQFVTLAKDSLIYPAFTGEAAADAREQTLRTVVDHLLVKRGDYRDLFTTRGTFMSPALAAIYHVPAKGAGWTPYEFPADSPRAGLLTQISFLALHAHPGRSSSTLRGKALREVLLCEVVPRPPPNVDFSAVENPDPNLKTARQRVAFHLKAPACAACHRLTDPMGLTMESFDGAGEFRTNEHGQAIDTTGSLDGVSFKDVAGLGKALHDNPQLPWCLVSRAFAYGTGTASEATDRRVLEYLSRRFSQDGYVVPDLLRDIVLSRAFRTVYRPHPHPTYPLPDLNSARATPAGDSPLVPLEATH